MNEISEILDNVEQFNSYVYEEKENYFLTLFNGQKIYLHLQSLIH